ncbi:hypothetical protein [Rhizobium sp. 18065]|uniref:hypothetical protein n=1 Tax=Rhizobium sp. 18065 TaxID=2681411 RepID=UPI001357A6E7|nr:hypothetical protein [Rhizobium sp. 18065]
MGAGPQAQEQLFALRQAVALIEGKASHAARMAADPGHADAALRSRIAANPVAAGSVSAGPDAAGSHAVGSGNRDFDQLMAEIAVAGTMVEIRSARMQDAGAASGFAFALSRLLDGRNGTPRRTLLIADPFVSREAGILYAPGLADFGLEAGEVIHALPRRIEDALWLADAALSSRAFSAVLFEVHGNPQKFGLTESRRLSLKARATGGTLFLLRQSGEEEASSASLRLLVEPAPAMARVLSDGSLLGGSIGHPVFRILAEKSRSSGFSALFLEWIIHDRRLKPVSPARFVAPSVVSGAAPSGAPSSPPGGSAYPGDLLSPAGHGQAGAPPLGALVAFERAS